MRCASCASPRITAGNNRLHCLFRQARISTHQGWRFSAGCSSSQSAILAIKRRPRWCAGSSRPSMSSTIQYSSGSQLACHCRSRLPVRLLPVAPQFAPAAARWSLWHCLTKDRHTAAAARFVTAHRQSAASQSLRPVGQLFCPLPHPRARQPPRRAFVARRTSRAVFHFPDEALHAATVCRPATSHPDVVASVSGIVHFAIQWFSKRAVDMDSPA